MEYLAAFLVTITALSAVIARWTRLHPLVVALIAGVPGGLPTLLAAGGTLSTAVWPAAGSAFVVTAGFGALGAFVGWLRRDFVKRNR